MPTKTKGPEAARKPSFLVWGVVTLIVVVGAWLAFTKLPEKKRLMEEEQKAVVQESERKYEKEPISLPAPAKTGRTSLEQALNSRRSRRAFLEKELSLKQFSQLMWALQGVTGDFGGRTAPSAKEAYPLEVYAVVNNVAGLEKGVYHYIPGTFKSGHRLGLVKAGDFKAAIEEAAVQSPAKNVPLVILLAANFAKMTEAFDGVAHDGNVYLEAGHAAQNLYLQVESLGLGMVSIGGFNPAKTAEVIGMPKAEKLIYLVPVGYPQL